MEIVGERKFAGKSTEKYLLFIFAPTPEREREKEGDGRVKKTIEKKSLLERLGA